MTWTAGALALLYLFCLFLAPVPSFVGAEEGASWMMMDSLASEWWTSSALTTPASTIDPDGLYAGPFIRAGGGRWYSAVRPLLPLMASVPFEIFGAPIAWLIPGLATILCLLLAARISSRLEPGLIVPAAIGSMAVAPLLVGGAIFSPVPVAAALILASSLLFVVAGESTGEDRGTGLQTLLAAELCAALAAVAHPDATWFVVAAPLAWAAIFRPGLGPMRALEGGHPMQVPLFLGAAPAASLLMTAAASLIESDPDAAARTLAHAAPMMAPLMLAAFGLAGLFARRSVSAAQSLRLAAWTIVAAGGVFQIASLHTALSIRAENAALASTLESATHPGDAIVTEEASVPLVAASLAPTRAILLVRSGSEVEGVLDGLSDAGVGSITAVSLRPSSPGDPLAARPAIGSYAREGDPRSAGPYLISTFTGAGSHASRPSHPPRGD